MSQGKRSNQPCMELLELEHELLEKRNLCCGSHTVCGVLLQQPQQIKTPMNMFNELDSRIAKYTLFSISVKKLEQFLGSKWKKTSYFVIKSQEKTDDCRENIKFSSHWERNCSVSDCLTAEVLLAYFTAGNVYTPFSRHNQISLRAREPTEQGWI